MLGVVVTLFVLFYVPPNTSYIPCSVNKPIIDMSRQTFRAFLFFNDSLSILETDSTYV